MAAEVFSTKPFETSSDQRKICTGSTVAGSVTPPGGVAMKARMPIMRSGAVSPSARAMPMIVPVSMPGRASGRTCWNTTCTGDAPMPSAASRMLGGTDLIALRPAMTITGMVISASVMPPTKAADRGRCARLRKPNPFPKSIYENIAYGPRIHGLAAGKADMDVIVEKSLRRAGLWEEVKDRLTDSGTALSGGQQQRLCIGRAIAVEPEVILMDEPCSALDPIATAKIEELIHELRGRYGIVIVTHNMQQAARVSQRTAFFHLGELVEYGVTSDIFTNPRQERTKDYITGRYG